MIEIRHRKNGRILVNRPDLNTLAGLDLRGADLEGADLRGVDLGGRTSEVPA